MVHGRIRYILPQNTSCNAKGILEKLLDHANGPDDENRTSETAFRKQHLPSDVFLTISCVQFRFLLTWLYDNVSRCILKIRWWCTNSCFSPYVSRLVLVDVAPRIRSTIHCKGSHRKWWKGAERKPIDRCNHDWVTSPFQEPVYMGIHLGFKHALARSADSNFVYGIASQGKLADAMAFLSIELNAGSKQIASYGVGPCTRSGTCWFMWALRESDKTRRVNYPLASRPTPSCAPKRSKFPHFYPIAASRFSFSEPQEMGRNLTDSWHDDTGCLVRPPVWPGGEARGLLRGRSRVWTPNPRYYLSTKSSLNCSSGVGLRRLVEPEGITNGLPGIPGVIADPANLLIQGRVLPEQPFLTYSFIWFLFSLNSRSQYSPFFSFLQIWYTVHRNLTCNHGQSRCLPWISQICKYHRVSWWSASSGVRGISCTEPPHALLISTRNGALIRNDVISPWGAMT
jgi:hypothetical protein